MKAWTFDQVADKLERDLAMQDQTFITRDEMAGYCNEALDEVEAEMLRINEDYFLTKSTISIVASTQDYAMPTNLWASKIRFMWVLQGADYYEVKKLRGRNKFREAMELTQTGNSTDRLKYLSYLDAATGLFKASFYPIPAANATANIWYIRNANRVPIVADSEGLLAAQNAAILDIPEAMPFVVQFMKVRCYEKEGDPRLEIAVAALEKQREQLHATLANKEPDNDDEIQPDFTHYEEST